MRAACHTNLILPNLIILIIFGEEFYAASENENVCVFSEFGSVLMLKLESSNLLIVT
jgi:hypothetical protein